MEDVEGGDEGDCESIKGFVEGRFFVELYTAYCPPPPDVPTGGEFASSVSARDGEESGSSLLLERDLRLRGRDSGLAGSGGGDNAFSDMLNRWEEGGEVREVKWGGDEISSLPA